MSGEPPAPKSASSRNMSTAGTDDPCKLVTQDEAQTAMGVEVTPAMPVEEGQMSDISFVGMEFCRFRPAARPEAPVGVLVGLSDFAVRETLAKYLESTKAQLNSSPVPDMGDQALWFEYRDPNPDPRFAAHGQTSAVWDHLLVIKGDKALAVKVVKNDEQLRIVEAKPNVLELARKALERI